MKFILNKDKLYVEDMEEINSGSVNYYEAEVEHDESWNELNIAAIIVPKEGGQYGEEGTNVAVINNKFYIDKKMSGRYGIGFVGYKIENEKKIYQISSNLKDVHFNNGAGEVETIEEELLTPTQWEIYIVQIQDMLDDESLVRDINYVHTDNNFNNDRKNKLDNLINYDDTEVKQKIADLEENKVDKVQGKVLSTNDFDNTYKGNVDNNTSARHTHNNKEVLDDINSTDISNWNNKSDFSGSYDDLSNKPTIPDEVTENTVSGWGFTKNTGTYTKPNTGIPKTDLANDVQTSLEKADTALQQHQDISGKLDTSKVKSAISSTSGDVYDVIYINTMIGNIESLLGGI